MKQLDRKLVRDLSHLKGQSLAISLVIASGVATFVMSVSTWKSIELSRSTYYERYRFAQVFAQMKRAPNYLRDRIADIPGVARVQTRIVSDVTIDVPGLAEPAVGRLISVPDMRRPELNDLYLRSGQYLDPTRTGQVLVNEAFAQAHQLTPGDKFRAIINGRLKELTICGIVLSPEFVLQIRPGDMLPELKRFGVFWMREEELEAAFDLDGAFNDLAVQLLRGASEPEVIARIDALIEPYGGTGAYGREDQLSHRFLSDEIRGLRSMAIVAPSIFLSVAAFLLNVVLSRLIGLQREQIAALKAFGYSKFEIGLHYIKFVLIVTVLGVILGTAFGAYLGKGMTVMYAKFYRFPIFYYRVEMWVATLAFLLSSAAAIVGTLSAVYKAVSLPPAEAMRPEPPPTFKPTFVERWGLQAFLAQSARMILRQLERRPWKSLLSSMGIALAVAVLVMGNFMEDSFAYLVEYQFFISQRQDMSIALVEPTRAEVIYEVQRLPGVLRSEPCRTVSVKLRKGHRTERLGIMGLPPGGELYRLMDRNERPVEVPEEGLALSDSLAETLGVKAGDSVTVEVQEAHRPIYDVPVTKLVADYAGKNAYMDQRALHRLMREGDTINSVFLSVDQKYTDELYSLLKETPRVAGVTVKRAMVDGFNETVRENMMRMKAVNVLFACVIAFGVVYNTARISLSERSRELATLRVIGFTRGEISAILLGELAVLTLFAIPLGFGIGILFALITQIAFNTELFRLPLVISSWTFAFAATIVMIAALLSGLVVRRRLDELDLVAVLKSKE